MWEGRDSAGLLTKTGPLFRENPSISPNVTLFITTLAPACKEPAAEPGQGGTGASAIEHGHPRASDDRRDGKPLNRETSVTDLPVPAQVACSLRARGAI
jgi:hypothetical protein